jgi:alpha-glucosidase
VQHTGQTPKGPLELQVYLPNANAGDCRGALYQDDGESFAYRDGEALRMRYGCTVEDGAVAVTARVEENGFAPWWSDVQVILFGVERRPASVTVEGVPVRGWRFDQGARTVVLTVSRARSNWRLELRR